MRPEQQPFKIPSLEEALRVARGQYDASVAVIKVKESWPEIEKKIRDIHAVAEGMNDIQKEEYFRGQAENHKNGLQALRDFLDQAIASHPDNKNGKARKNKN